MPGLPIVYLVVLTGLAAQFVAVAATDVAPLGLQDDGAFQITVTGQKGPHGGQLCLDLYSGKNDNGTPIDIWECQPKLKTQLWYFTVGTFKIRSAQFPDKCIDGGDMKSGTALKLWDCNTLGQQFWAFSQKTSTIYLQETTTTAATMCMDVKDAVYKSGTPVQVWKCDGLSNQGWTIQVPADPFVLKIDMQNQNLCLDLYGQKTDNGTPIDVWTCSGGKGQQWLFVPGSFKIQSALNPNKCIDAQDMKFRTQLKIWDCNSLPQQTWGYDSQTESIFLGKAKNQNSLCMCMTDTKNGAPIQLYTCNTQSTEKFKFTAASQFIKSQKEQNAVQVV